MVMVNPRTSNSDLVPRLSSGGDYLRGRVSSQYNPSILSPAFRAVCNFLRPKRPLSRTKIAIEQLRNFFSRAWFPNLVQRSKDMVFEAAVRVWNLTHF